MATIALGSGVVEIEGVYRAILEAGFDGHTTLDNPARFAARD
jgi:hypothetical protein